MPRIEMPRVRVAVAAIVGADGRLLISRRPEHLHQGGLLEFPGGKVDMGETVAQALVRELQEELGITPLTYQPLIKIPYDYPDKRVLLDVWRVTRYLGQPRGLEGQALQWLAIEELDPEQFPAANRAIISALTLPSRYLISGVATDREQWLLRLQAALESGLRMVQLRAHELDDAAYRALASAALECCRPFCAKLILNRDPQQVRHIEADGLHLNRHQLARISAEQLAPWRQRLLGASCHNAAELQQAQRWGLDYALLSPVLATSSHPGAQTLSWSGFSERVAAAGLPVYALGGMASAMESTAITQGGQGIASISAFW